MAKKKGGSSLSFGLRLINKIIQEHDFKTVMLAGINKDMLRNSEARTYYGFLKEYYHHPNHYGAVPTAQIMKRQFPGYKHLEIDETIGELCELVRVSALRAKILDMADEISELAEDDPYKAVDFLNSETISLHRVSTPTSGILVAADETGDIINERYNARINPEGPTHGILWPWKGFAGARGVIAKNDFVVIYGRPGTMKTWSALKVGVDSYARRNRRVLIYSAEMPEEEILERTICILAGIDYTKMDQGLLTPEEEIVYRNTYSYLKEQEEHERQGGHSPCLVVQAANKDPFGGGVVGIKNYIEIHKPDLIVVDSFYKMKDDRTGKKSMNWEQQYNIVQDLKIITNELDVPIIGVTQRKRKKNESSNAEDAEDAAFADAIAQEANLIVRNTVGKVIHDLTRPLKMQTVKNRRGVCQGALLRVIPSSTWILDGILSPDGARLLDPEGNDVGACPDFDTPPPSNENKKWGGKGKGIPDDDRPRAGVKLPPSWSAP